MNQAGQIPSDATDACLSRLLFQRDDFSDSYASATFWQGSFPPELLQSLFCWHDLNTCLAHNRITNDRFRLTSAEGHAQLNARAFRAVRDALGRPTDHVQWHEVHTMLRDGATAVLESVHELSPPVDAMTRALEHITGARAAANAYLSFGATSGFGIHHDDHDVIVLQLHGDKRWQFFQHHGAHSGKARVTELRTPGMADRGDELILREGDVMYIPKGTWHDVTAMQVPSLHLTVSMVHPTLHDFFHWALQRHPAGLPLLDLRPGQIKQAQALGQCHEWFSHTVTEERLLAFCTHHRASRAGRRLAPDFPALHAVRRDECFTRVPFDFAMVQGTEESPGNVGSTPTKEIYAMGRVHALSQLHIDLLKAMNCTAAKSARSLHEHIPGAAWQDVAAALRELMDCGLAGKQADLPPARSGDRAAR